MATGQHEMKIFLYNMKPSFQPIIDAEGGGIFQF